jgi:hypothetical protein
MTAPQINDGGPAFPCEEQIRCNGEVIDTRKFTGMTLRDWFAGQALAGLCASTDHESAPSKGILADWAYQQADAMLAAREVKP